MMRGHGADQDRFGDPALAAPRNVARHFAATRGVPDVDRLSKIERFGELGDIGIHVVAGRSLRGATMAPAIMGDDAIALVEEERHLRVPIIGAKRPAMMEDDGLAGAPSPCRKFPCRLSW
jgi:hypothetical protein